MVGLNVMVHGVTVYAAVNVVGPDASEATKEPAPAVAPYGTLYVQVNAPAPEVVIVAPETVPTVQASEIGAVVVRETPSNASVTDEDAAKLVAVTVTLLPMSPLVGERAIVHGVTVNAAVAVCAV